MLKVKEVKLNYEIILIMFESEFRDHDVKDFRRR